MKNEDNSGCMIIGGALFGIAIAYYLVKEYLWQLAAWFFMPMDRLLFISEHIPPALIWTLFGLLIGAIYGTWVAIRKYQLEYTLLIYPVTALLVTIAIISLAA